MCATAYLFRFGTRVGPPRHDAMSIAQSPQGLSLRQSDCLDRGLSEDSRTVAELESGHAGPPDSVSAPCLPVTMCGSAFAIAPSENPCTDSDLFNLKFNHLPSFNMTTVNQAHGLYELGAIPKRDVTRFQRIVEFVEKYQIKQPNTDQWGIYYDPDIQSAHCYPPHNGVLPGPSDPKVFEGFQVSALGEERLPRYFTGTHQELNTCAAAVALGFDDSSRRRVLVGRIELEEGDQTGFGPNWHLDANEINTHILALERRQHVDGLHYIRVAPFPGCRWIYGKYATLLLDGDNEPSEHLARPANTNSYSGHATKVMPVARNLVQFGDHFRALLELFQGDIFFASKWQRERKNYDVCCFRNFTFGVAVAAHDPRETNATNDQLVAGTVAASNSLKSARSQSDQIDGHLGLGHAHRRQFSYHRQPDLFVSKIRGSSGSREELPGFTIALGRDDAAQAKCVRLHGRMLAKLTWPRTSWIGFGDMQERSAGIPRTEWSSPVQVDSAERHFWAPRLFAAHIGQGELIVFTDPVSGQEGIPVVLDTGSELSALPNTLTDAMDFALSATRDVGGDGAIDPHNKQSPNFNQTIFFHFDNGVTVEGPLHRFVDQRDTSQFWTGYIQGPINTGEYLLGNMFFRGLVVDFEYSSDGTESQVRFANRMPGPVSQKSK
uniref:Peptidase A1 domain-containing protein n=1 Tax=Mycena chlorophos TaxID=658473 RepID=A0ABQ0M705_MYCCL|nr:predicted protein [Mycena chlorophos]